MSSGVLVFKLVRQSGESLASKDSPAVKNNAFVQEERSDSSNSKIFGLLRKFCSSKILLEIVSGCHLNARNRVARDANLFGYHTLDFLLWKSDKTNSEKSHSLQVEDREVSFTGVIRRS